MFDFFESISSNRKRISRSISAENVYGKPGSDGMANLYSPQENVLKIGQLWSGIDKFPTKAASKLGPKHKVRPCILLAAGSDTVLMDIESMYSCNK